VIAGTTFHFAPPEAVPLACLRHGKRFGASVSEIAEVKAECEAERAMCLECEDGVVVVTPEALSDGSIELFVLLAVAYRHGAFERQDAALRAIARDLGADVIAFRARRRGWARVLGPEWQRRGTDEFVRTIDGR
jgi:hypothetical protein